MDAVPLRTIPTGEKKAAMSPVTATMAQGVLAGRLVSGREQKREEETNADAAVSELLGAGGLTIADLEAALARAKATKTPRV